MKNNYKDLIKILWKKRAQENVRLILGDFNTLRGKRA